MSRNSFKDLEKLNQERFKHSEKDVLESVSSSINIFKFIGDIFELYLPRVIGMLVGMSGVSAGPGQIKNEKGDQPDDDLHYPNTREK